VTLKHVGIGEFGYKYFFLPSTGPFQIPSQSRYYNKSIRIWQSVTTEAPQIISVASLEVHKTIRSILNCSTLCAGDSLVIAFRENHFIGAARFHIFHDAEIQANTHQQKTCSRSGNLCAKHESRSVCLSVYLSVYLSVRLSIYPLIDLSYLSTNRYVYYSIWLKPPLMALSSNYYISWCPQLYPSCRLKCPLKVLQLLLRGSL